MKVTANILLLISLLMSSYAFAVTSKVRDYETDGCTAYSDGTFEKPKLWQHCCKMHDLYYWAGGTSAERDSTDKKLKACVALTGETMQAEVIYLGVRIGAMSPMKFGGKQWGNAWSSEETRNKKLSLKEIDLIDSEIEKKHYDTLLSWREKSNFIYRLRQR